MAEKKVKVALNLRAKASLKAAIVTVIPSGTVLTVPDDDKGGAWTKVEYNDLKGFVKSEFLTEV